MTGDTLKITGSRPSIGLQPCRAIWYFAHVDTLGTQLSEETPFTIHRSTSDYLGGSFFAPDGKKLLQKKKMKKINKRPIR